jgi:hypothetical protein
MSKMLFCGFLNNSKQVQKLAIRPVASIVFCSLLFVQHQFAGFGEHGTAHLQNLPTSWLHVELPTTDPICKMMNKMWTKRVDA